MTGPPDAERGPEGPSSHSSTPDQGLRNTSDDNPVRDRLDSLVGIGVDGGCADCTAYQTIERLDAKVYVNRVFHDDTSPWWIRYQAATR